MPITYRAIKGSKLTISEIDSNFSYLDDRISDIDSAYIEAIVDSDYVQARAGTIEINRFDFTADSGDTIFTGVDDNSNTLSFDSSSTQVYLNGLLLNPSLDYTLSGHDTVTTSAGIDSDHLVTITTITIT